MASANPQHVLDVLRQSCRSARRFAVCDYARFPQQQPQMPEWREKLVVWMQMLGKEFRFTPECIEVAVSYFDRLMSRVQVGKDQLQTAALACILIATKQHETCALSLAEVNSRMEKITTTAALIKMEVDVLSVLHWDANTFTPIQFVQCALSLITDPAIAAQVRGTAEHILQSIAIKRYELLQFSPCAVGLAAIAAACSVHGYQYEGLVMSLKAQDIPVELDNELFEFLRTRYLEELALERAAAHAMLFAENALRGSPMPGRPPSMPNLSRPPSTIASVRTSAMSPELSEAASVSGSMVADMAALDMRAKSAEGGKRHSLLGPAGHGIMTRARSFTESRRSPGPLAFRAASVPIPEDDEDLMFEGEVPHIVTGAGEAAPLRAAPVPVRGAAAALNMQAACTSRGLGAGRTADSSADDCMPGMDEAVLCPGPVPAMLSSCEQRSACASGCASSACGSACGSLGLGRGYAPSDHNLDDTLECDESMYSQDSVAQDFGQGMIADVA